MRMKTFVKNKWRILSQATDGGRRHLQRRNQKQRRAGSPCQAAP